ncbi:hypothetical protein ACTFIW_008977 [Dictyostelium discoideum]
MSIVDIKFTINDVLLNRESLQNNNKYSCPICYEFIYNKSIYQCKSGHFACQGCWEKSLKNKKECMICRSKVNSIYDLSRCLVIEQFFSKEECYCIYSYTYETLVGNCVNEKQKINLVKDEINGCKDIKTVDLLDSHIQNCKFKFVPCSNKGCDKIVRLKSLQEHEEQCGYRLTVCSYCVKYFQKNQVKNHFDECPKYFIDCLKGCQMKIKREDSQKHIDNDCGNKIIQCKYYEYGCKVEMKRSELPYHLENVNHQTYMGLLIDKLNLTVTKHEEHLNSVLENNKKLLKILNIGNFSNVYKNKWITPNFPNILDLFTERKKCSPKFFINLNEFFISIKVNQTDMSIYLNHVNDEPVKVEYSLKLVNVLDEKKSILHQENERVFKDSGTSFGHDFIKKREIKYGWLNDSGELTIKIYVRVINEVQPLTS